VALGGGRDKVEDAVDPGVGIMIRATVGEPVRAGDVILELRYRHAARLQAALPLVDAAVHVSPEPPAWQDLIIEEVT
jgi:thymidine phosphorylase